MNVDGKHFVFIGDQYFKVDQWTRSIENGYPKKISEGWFGLDENFEAGDFSACVNWNNGKFYFFKNSQYVRYD